VLFAGQELIMERTIFRRIAGVLAAVALLTCVDANIEAKAEKVPQSQAPNVQRGMAIARLHCARCHSIDRLSQSPLRDAPAFRDLHKRYPLEQLEETLAEGLVTGHPAMPEFRFDVDQIDSFIAFLKSLE